MKNKKILVETFYYYKFKPGESQQMNINRYIKVFQLYPIQVCHTRAPLINRTMPIFSLLIVLAKLIVSSFFFPFLLTASKKGNIFNGVKQENAGFVFDKFVFSQVIFLGISFL